MTYVANTPACSTGGKGNTGIASCNFDLKRIAGIIAVPISSSLTAADVLDLKTTLQAKCVLDDRNARYYPIFNVTGIEDSSAAADYYTSGYGDMEKTTDGKYHLTMTVRDGGLCRHVNLRDFENEEHRYYLCDEYGQILGTKNSSGDGTGLTGTLTVMPFKMPTATEPSLYQFKITFEQPDEINNRTKVWYVDTDKGINWKRDILGCLEVELYTLANVVGTLTVGIRTACGKTNLYDTYDDEFASAALWNCINVATGGAVTISAVAKNTTLKAWDLSITNPTSPSAALPVIVSLDGPATLVAASIGGAPGNGYEDVENLAVTLPIVP